MSAASREYFDDMQRTLDDDLDYVEWITTYDAETTAIKEHDMSLTIKDNGSGEYELAPVGTHLAICYLLVDLGPQDSTFGVKNKIAITWELPHELMEDGRPFSCSKIYTNSLNEKANLRKDLETWRTRLFTETELAGFDLRNVLGKACQLTIVHQTKGDKTYANIAGIAAVAKGMTVPPAHNSARAYDRDAHDPAVFETLPEWMQKKIEAAVHVPRGREEHNELNPPDFDDDIPF